MCSRILPLPFLPVDILRFEFILGLVGPGRMADGNDVQRDNIVGYPQALADESHSVMVGIGSGPERAQPQGLGGQQDIFTGTGRVDYGKGETLIVRLVRHGADDDGSTRLVEHFGVRQAISQLVQGLPVRDRDKGPRLPVDRGGGRHACAQDGIELCLVNTLAGKIPHTFPPMDRGNSIW